MGGVLIGLLPFVVVHSSARCPGCQAGPQCRLFCVIEPTGVDCVGGEGHHVEGAGTYRIGAGDLITHPSPLRHQWLLVDDEPADALLVITE